MFSRACEYAIRASIYLAQRPDRRAALKEIAAAIGSPKAFTAKILQDLARGKIVESLRGPAGGYMLAVSEEGSVRLGRIVEIIDGDGIYRNCGLGLRDCNAEKPCPLHDRFMAIREDLRNMLETTGIDELAAGLREGKVFLAE